MRLTILQPGPHTFGPDRRRWARQAHV